MTEDSVEIPPELIELHKNVTVGIDFFCANGKLLFVTTSLNIKFCAVENSDSVKMKSCFKILKSVMKICNKKGFVTDWVSEDRPFKLLKPSLEEKFKISLSPAAASKHVGEAESMILIVKERARAGMSAMPWKMDTPKIIVTELARNAVMMIDSFPLKIVISTRFSPCNIMTG